MAALMNAIFAESMRGYRLQPKLGISRSTSSVTRWWMRGFVNPVLMHTEGLFRRKPRPPRRKSGGRSHPFCRCRIEWLRSIQAGTATVSGETARITR